MFRHAVSLLFAALALGPILGAGCRSGSELVLQAWLSADTMVPNVTGARDNVTLFYILAREAQVDILLVSSTGQVYALRQKEVRPPGPPYRLDFDGTYAPDPATEERRVIPDGEYRYVVTARDSLGQVHEASGDLKLRGGDSLAPQLDPVEVFPGVITPNFDGVDDIANVSFRLSKKAEVWAYLTDDKGRKVDFSLVEVREPGEYVLRWTGVVKDKALPDGPYMYHLLAKDGAGNVTEAQKQILIETGGMPEARITSVRFTPHELMLGDLLRVEITVKNVGSTPLRTQGPDPGFTYSSYDSFGSVEDNKYVDRRGFWRVGVDWAGASISGGARFPYRWGFGRDLQPGEEVTVVGNIRMLHRVPRLWIFAALVQEGVRYHQEGVGRSTIEVGFSGREEAPR